MEHTIERTKQDKLLIEFLTTNRGIAFNQMFAMKEYPRDILPLYSQGYSLARYFIAMGGKRKFVDYLADGMKWNNWTAATQEHYSVRSLSELQVTWLDWVSQGCPNITPGATGGVSDIAHLAPNQTGGSTTSPSGTASAHGTGPNGLVPLPPRSAPNTGDNTSDRMLLSSPSDGWYSRRRDEAVRESSRQHVGRPKGT